MNKIMAHRGWSSKAPENTLAAFQLTLNEPWIASIEMDVQLSKDGVPVIIHDFQVARTTNGTGNVRDLTLAELRLLDAGSWFNPQFSTEKIPCLEEVLLLCKGKKKLNLELKTIGDMYKDIAKKVVELVIKFEMESEVVITSFEVEQVKRVKDFCRKIETGIIIDKFPRHLDEQIKYTGANTISINHWLLSRKFVKANLARGRNIITWTPNSYVEIALAKHKSPSIEICTNYPERAR